MPTPKGLRDNSKRKTAKPTLDLSVEASLRDKPGEVLTTPPTDDVWQVMNALMNNQPFVIKDKFGKAVKDRTKVHKIILRCLTIVAHCMEYNHSLSFLEYKKALNHGSLSKSALESLLAVVAAMNITGSELSSTLEDLIANGAQDTVVRQRITTANRYLGYLKRVLHLVDQSAEASVSNSIEIMIKNTQSQLKNALTRLEACIEKNKIRQPRTSTKRKNKGSHNSHSFNLNKVSSIKQPVPSEVISWLYDGLIQDKSSDERLETLGIGRRRGEEDQVQDLVQVFKDGSYPSFPESVHDAIGVLKAFCEDNRNYTENYDINAKEQLEEIIQALIDSKNGFSANSLSHFQSILDKFPLVEGPKSSARSRL